MTAATSQPSPPITIDTPYVGKVDGGWVGYDYVGNAVGTASLTPTAQFTALKTQGSLANGDITLSANSATDTGAVASLTIGKSPTRNNFTVVGVFRVRNASGSGVGMRSSSNDILFWRNTSGNYSIRINGVTTTGGAMPLNSTLNYVIASSTAGIYVYVNGTLIISAAASASATTTGSNIEIYEDSLGGGAMDLDVSECVLLNYGAGQTEAQSLSNNPYQIFAASGATNTAVNPSVGSLALTGYAPQVAQSANQSATPSAGTLAISGYAPSITQSVNTVVSPAAGTVAITGYPPAVAQSANVSITTASGALAITGYAPTVRIVSNVTIQPSQGTLTLTGYAPAVRQAVNIVPHLTLSTIMRTSSLAMKGGTLTKSTAVSAGTMSSKLALSTIMRAQATSRTAAIHTNPINLTVSFP